MVDSSKYLFLGLYIALTYWLSIRGMRKAKTFRSFSISKGDLSPFIVGVTMAASIASTATFVINPGFVYTHGLSAYLHYGVAGFLGITAGLIAVTKGFRKLGGEFEALTVPHWMMGRYKCRGLAVFFALANLLSVTFVVLILVGCALLVAALFGVSQKLALVLVLLFVFSYVLMGGSYAHAYTNTFQSIMMIVIALVLFFSGFHYLGDFGSELSKVGSSYAAILNPDSDLYFDMFSVFISGFIITAALMMQPHILTKVLYLKDDSQVSRFLWSACGIGLVFTLVLFVGFYARFAGLEVPRQDQTMTVYLQATFSESGMGQVFLAWVTISLLAAGMSTLDGILVALSASVVNDLIMPMKPDLDSQKALAWSRWALIGIGLLALLLAWNPPALVGIFAQKGVYGLAAASVVPIVGGIFYRHKMPLLIPWVSAILGLGGHLFYSWYFEIKNPSVSASYAILTSAGWMVLSLAICRIVPHFAQSKTRSLP